MSTLPGNSSKTKVATTEQLLAICLDESVKKVLAADLDPGGIHVCARHFFHDATLAIRGVWFVCVPDSEDPRVALVDMEMKDFFRLPYYEDLYDR